MNIKIAFDFHDIFVNAHDAWIKAFSELSNNKQIVTDYENKISKKDICLKYNLDYEEAEELYRSYLTKIDKNIEFAKRLSEFYDIDLISLSRKSRLMKDIDKFGLKDIFTSIYAKEDITTKDEFLKDLSEKYDWIVFFNHENNRIIELGNIIYMPIDFQGNLDEFKNKSFTEHAKNKLLYNELSKYYMQAIVNDTNQETDFVKKVYRDNISITPGTILDCCCGVGRHDYLLANSDYKVTGIDISQNQIDTANKNNKTENVNYQVMDVRDINLPFKDYDMSICMWTTYNYLSLDKDFLKFIKSNYNHQKEGGILILDAKNIPRLEKRRVYKRNDSYKNKMELELIVNKFVINNIQNSQYFYFINENGNKKFYMDEEFVRFYNLDEIKELTKDYYEVINVYGDFDFSDYDVKNSNRFIVVLRRK
ncbi:MAG: class I SAM-dependent methyltransferase [bacterium]|nr:class I SAM-dependent methyltransferase [bacterium]